MKKSDPKLKEMRPCSLCHKPFEIYKSHTTKLCPSCRSKEHTKTCIHCGETVTFDHKKNGAKGLSTFISSDFCSTRCYQDFHFGKPSILQQIFCEMFVTNNPDHLHQPDPEVLDTVVAQNYARLRLYLLYSYLEPYYDEDETIDFRKYLPHTQTYLKDILRRIKNLKEILC